MNKKRIINGLFALFFVGIFLNCQTQNKAVDIVCEPLYDRTESSGCEPITIINDPKYTPPRLKDSVLFFKQLFDITRKNTVKKNAEFDYFVDIYFNIDKSGKVNIETDINIDMPLDSLALNDLVLKTKWEPALYDGIPVDERVDFSFSLFKTHICSFVFYPASFFITKDEMKLYLLYTILYDG